MRENFPLTCKKYKDDEKFRPVSACAVCAGLHGSKLIANVFNVLLIEHASYIRENGREKKFLHIPVCIPN